MIVNVSYHHELEGVWADSPDVEGLVVAGATIAEVRELVRDGLPFYLEGHDIDLRESFEGSATALLDLSFEGAGLGSLPSNASYANVMDMHVTVARTTKVTVTASTPRELVG